MPGMAGKVSCNICEMKFISCNWHMAKTEVAKMFWPILGCNAVLSDGSDLPAARHAQKHFIFLHQQALNKLSTNLSS
jgi:hypothetical protein